MNELDAKWWKAGYIHCILVVALEKTQTTCKGVRVFQNEYDDKFKNMGEKFQKLEEKINLLK